MAKNIVIIGGGFGGLCTAKELLSRQSSLKKERLDITLVDRRNHHLFQPLLYQVATAGLSPADIAAPIRSIFTDDENVRVLLGEVHQVELAEQRVVADFGPLPYDYLIVACGAQHSYFGNDAWESLAPGLKTLEQATEIRRRILLAFENAEKEPDLGKQKALLTFAIVGAGPTGVELAGAIAEMSRQSLAKDFRRIDPSRTRVILIEGGPRILPQFSEKLARQATQDLEKMGVHVWTHSKVSNISAAGIQCGADFVEARTVLWAAGVKPSVLATQLGCPLDKLGRAVVQADLSLANAKNIFVIGDMACAYDSAGTAFPGVAPVAMQQGRHAARNIIYDLVNKERKPFVYKDKGQMATIGRKKAVVQTRSFSLTGFWAWLAWLFIHIYYLIGFRNKVFVFFQWAWSYVTYKKGARLIAEKD